MATRKTAKSAKKATAKWATKKVAAKKSGTKRTSAKKAPSKRASPRAKLRKLAAMMRGIDFCMLTTRARDGVLRARPMSNNGEVDFDGSSWFFSAKDSRKVAEIGRDDHVSVTLTGGTRRAPVWIVITGRARIVEDVATKTELWVDELAQWFPDGPDDPGVVLLHVEADHASWWSFEGDGEVTIR